MSSIFLSFFLIFSSLVFAEEKIPVFVDADQYVSKPDQSAVLTGHVKIIKGAEQLTCDRATIDVTKNQVVADGNVILITPKEFVRAEKMTYNFSTKKGIIINGFIQMGQETIEGEEIYKAGEKDYKAKYASYTSCVNCPASWKLSGTHIDATAGSYAHIRNPIIKIYGVPVLWLPYMIIPIKSERQSGLLPPFYGISGDDGFIIGDSFFWAIDRSKDMTITGTSYKNRGVMGGVEYRYVSDENSKGYFYGTFINDGVYANHVKYLNPDSRYWNLGSPNPPYRPLRDREYSVHRYSFHYDHHFELPNDFYNNVKLNVIRDPHFIYDFPNRHELEGYGEPALENRISLTKNFENTHTSADIGVYQDLIKADPVGDNDTALHRVPELRYSLLSRNLFNTGILLGGDVDYLNLSRSGKTFSDLQVPREDNSGFYRTGQRLIVHPTLSYPFKVGNFLDIVPEVAYDEARYQFGYSVSPSTSRRYVRATLHAKSHLSAVLGDERNPKETRYKHIFEPNVIYTQVPYLYQESHSFFGTRPTEETNYSSTQPITEFDNLQFDYKDRLVDRHLVTLGLTNKFIRKKWNGADMEYLEIIKHRLSQSYDIFNIYQANPLDFSTADPNDIVPIIRQPWGEIQSVLSVKLDYFGLDSDMSYFPYQNVLSSASGISLRDSKGNGVSTGYSRRFSYLRDAVTNLPTKNLDLATKSEALFLTVYFVSKYLDISGTTNYDPLIRDVTSQSLAGLLKPPGQCWGIEFSVTRSLNGNKSFQFQFPIFFGDGRKTSLSKPAGL